MASSNEKWKFNENDKNQICIVTTPLNNTESIEFSTQLIRSKMCCRRLLIAYQHLARRCSFSTRWPGPFIALPMSCCSYKFGSILGLSCSLATMMNCCVLKRFFQFLEVYSVSRKCILFCVYFALLLDNLLLTAVGSLFSINCSNFNSIESYHRLWGVCDFWTFQILFQH